MGVISPKLVTWLKMHCVLNYMYIDIKRKEKKKKKEKRKKKKKDNNPNPRKLTLNIRTKCCFLSIKTSSFMFSYIENIKKGLLISCFNNMKHIYKFNESWFIWIY